jgi:hypothetical protein
MSLSRTFRSSAMLSIRNGAWSAWKLAIPTVSNAREALIPYPAGEPPRHVGADGRRVSVEPGDGEAATPLVREGRTVAILRHRAGLLDDPGLVREVAAAAQLAIENERLHAEVLAQLEDLRAAQARIVATGDAERRRLERDLHDGTRGAGTRAGLPSRRIGPGWPYTPLFIPNGPDSCHGPPITRARMSMVTWTSRNPLVDHAV